MKPCRKCGGVERYAPTAGRKTGKCVACQARANRSWNQRNVKPRRERYLKALYGMTRSEYAALLCSQQGRCAICEAPLRRPCVDHDHETGAVRALLCVGCNSGIGSLRENPDTLRAAARYVEHHRAKREKSATGPRPAA